MTTSHDERQTQQDLDDRFIAALQTILGRRGIQGALSDGKATIYLSPERGEAARLVHVLEFSIEHGAPAVIASHGATAPTPEGRRYGRE